MSMAMQTHEMKNSSHPQGCASFRSLIDTIVKHIIIIMCQASFILFILDNWIKKLWALTTLGDIAQIGEEKKIGDESTYFQ